MTPIKQVTLENFQSHVSTTIKPAPPGQLTVITGPSDSGKTAILRALRWVFMNEPQGTDFIRAGASFARVIVEHENGIVVRHRTTGGTNRYLVNSLDGDAEKYEGFGNGVPLEAQEVTGVRPVTIGDLELNLNIAEQLSGPFLGSSISAPARAKVLGKLAGTEEIDYAGKQLGTDLFRRNQDERRLAGELSELDKRLRDYDWLPDMARKIEALEMIAAKIKAAQERRGKLALKSERLVHFDEKIIVEQAVLYRWHKLEQAETRLLDCQASLRDKKQLEILVTRYWTAQKVVLDSQAIINRHKGLSVAEEALRQAQERAVTVRQLRSLRTSYQVGMEMIQRSRGVVSSLEGLNAAERLLRDLDVKRQRRSKLDELDTKYTARNNLIISAQQLVEKYACIDAAEKISNTLQAQKERYARITTLRQRLFQAKFTIENARADAVLWENRVAELEGAYHDLLQIAGVCPLCGQKIKSKIKEAV